MSGIVTPFGPLGYITYKRTYARRLNENDPSSKTEEYADTIERVLKATQTQLKCNFTDGEINELREYFLLLKCSVAGRFLWQLGTKTVSKLGLASLQNCAATVVDSPIRPFTWTMDMLMLGSGVGYNIQKEYVYELPKVKKCRITRMETKDADFIVPDTRQGWVKLLELVLRSHFETGENFTYSTILVRGKGTLIRGFGGLASGPEDLCWGIEQIHKILSMRVGKKIRPIDALDIMNIIGHVVVAGNVRRSAQLSIGDMDDLQFLNAKNWGAGNIPNWRAMSNNSVVCNDIDMLPDQFWNGYTGNGEPYGLINLNLTRSTGRQGETQYPDPRVVCFNPCVSKDTLILTDKGSFPICFLSGKKINVWNGFEWSEVEPKITGTNQSMLKVSFSNGSQLRCTYYHKFYVKDETGEPLEIKAKDLKVGLTLIDWIDPQGKFQENIDITDILYSGIDRYVYCFDEPKRHLGIFNGVITGQCAEQSLENFETCCLAEIFLPNIVTKEELKKASTYLYRINKHSLALDCHHKETEDVVHQNMRMGIGVTGYLQATEEQKAWLSDTYEYLREYDREYSKANKFPVSIKLTTVKPSGTLSLLPNVTPGVHPAYSQHYIRRIRIASNSPLANLCRKHGYFSEYQKNFDGTDDKNIVVVSFPVSVPENTLVAKNLSAVEHLQHVSRLQKEWSDNAVSCTIYYRKEELGDIKNWLKHNYNDSVKSVSFLLHSEHGFVQAPYEEITKEQYEEYNALVESIVSGDISESDMSESFECVGGVCPVK